MANQRKGLLLVLEIFGPTLLSYLGSLLNATILRYKKRASRADGSPLEK
jgi:hypothetical protein